MTRAELMQALREELARRPEVRLGILFGSWARDAADTESDIDLAILGPDVDRLALAAELAEATGRDVQLQSLDCDLGVPFLEEIVRDGIVVREAEHGTAASWRTKALLALETDRPWYARMRDSWIRRVADKGL